jgi:aryl-alcohol dehydrogenase-like predicted oxidoreductase
VLATKLYGEMSEPGSPPPPGTRLESDVWLPTGLRDEVVLERVQKLRPIADELGISMARLALAWGAARAQSGVRDYGCDPG